MDPELTPAEIAAGDIPEFTTELVGYRLVHLEVRPGVYPRPAAVRVDVGDDLQWTGRGHCQISKHSARRWWHRTDYNFDL